MLLCPFTRTCIAPHHTGLTIFSVAPTTLGVGVALTTACGGNEAIALLLTVGTNMLAVATMPPELRLLLAGQSTGVGAAGPPVLAPALAPGPVGDGGGSGGSADLSPDINVSVGRWLGTGGRGVGCCAS